MKTKYICPECGNSVILHVNPSRPPTCINPTTHSSKRVTMQEQTSEKKGDTR